MRKLPSISHSYGKREKTKNVFSPPQKTGISLALLVLTIVVFGMVMLYSTTVEAMGAVLLKKQIMWIFLGILSACAVYSIGYKRLLAYSFHILIISCILLVLALFCEPVKGAHRWIHLPFGLGNIQPSQLATISVIMYLAYYIPRYQRRIYSSFKNLLPVIAASLLVLGLILLGEDLGTTLLLGAIIWIIFFIGGVKFRYLFLPFPFIPFIPSILKHYDKLRWQRIVAFLDPEKYQQDIGYQLWFSILALGSGSWTGLGFADSRMKANYLPEAHTDFILAIVGEELGYIAIFFIILAYLLFFILSVYISIKAKDKEGLLLGVGIALTITFQAIINIGVVSGALPTKGMSAPFISYGGSNMIVSLTCVGILLSIANYKGKKGKTPRLTSNIINQKIRKKHNEGK